MTNIKEDLAKISTNYDRLAKVWTNLNELYHKKAQVKELIPQLLEIISIMKDFEMTFEFQHREVQALRRK